MTAAVSSSVHILEPYFKDSGLKNVELGEHKPVVIGRVYDESEPDPVSHRARNIGVPPELRSFISRKHVRFEVKSKNEVSTTALSTFQDTNALIRVNPTPGETVTSPSSGGTILRKGVAKALKPGDLIILLAGAKQETTGCANELLYKLRSCSPAEAKASTKPPRVDDTLQIGSLDGRSDDTTQNVDNPVRKKRKKDIAEQPSRSAGSPSLSTAVAASASAAAALLDPVTCTLCLELFVDPWAVPCSQTHTFCRGCIELWLENNNTCPQCQATLPQGNKGNRNQTIIPVMEAFRQQGIIAGEDLQTWEERKAALNSATGESINSTGAADVVELLEDSDNDGDFARNEGAFEVIDLS